MTSTTEAKAVMPAGTQAEWAAKEDVEWLTWQGHRRTENIASYYGIPVKVIQSKSRGLVRYMLATVETLLYLCRRSPRVLIVQNPSMVLTLIGVLARPLFRYKLVVDAHNEAVQPFINTGPIMLYLSKWLLRQADLTIVTNSALADVVQNAGGTPAVLPDRLPDIQSREVAGARTRAVLISTFAKDEPIAEFLEAKRRVKRDIDLYVTGKLENMPDSIRREYSGAATFTGFLPEQEYCDLLGSSDFIIDLTLMENCLVCGAYEGVALAKPLILSDNRAVREYFHKGVVYVDDTIEGMVRGLDETLDHLDSLRIDIKCLRKELMDEWPKTAEELRQSIARS